MKPNMASIAILGIGTSVPPHLLEQGEVTARLVAALGEDSSSARWAKRIFRQCGVDTRYTCESNLLASVDECRYVPGTEAERIPNTSERMRKYKEESIPLGLQAAVSALRDSAIDASVITHLMTVSCTGQFLPGMDIALIRKLGLPNDVTRIPLQFMGCAAGLTAVRLAGQIVQGDPAATVLIVCVELCTLHIQPTGEREDLYGAAFFGDGASACVVGAASGQVAGVFELGKGQTVVLSNTEGEMIWNLGNYGFDLFLSPKIPEIIGSTVPDVIYRFLEGEPRPDLWAIHPGGRGIVDALQQTLQLTDTQTEASRSVLRQFGNLSSATILFVLDAMRRELGQTDSGPAHGIAIGFGPGMHTEMMLIRYVPSAVTASIDAGRVHA